MFRNVGKFLSVFLVLALLLGAMPTVAHAGGGITVEEAKAQIAAVETAQADADALWNDLVSDWDKFVASTGSDVDTQLIQDAVGKIYAFRDASIVLKDAEAVAEESGAYAIVAAAEGASPAADVVTEPVIVEDDPYGTVYINTIGFAERYFVEPGGLTGDAGDQECAKNESCWIINPDIQVKLTDDVQEDLACLENGYLLMSFAGADVSANSTTLMVLPAVANQGRLVLIKCLTEGDGDRNTQIVVTNFNGGFGTATNFPPAAGMSEGAIIREANNVIGNNCGGGCLNGVEVDVYDLNNDWHGKAFVSEIDGAWSVIE